MFCYFAPAELLPWLKRSGIFPLSGDPFYTYPPIRPYTLLVHLLAERLTLQRLPKQFGHSDTKRLVYVLPIYYFHCAVKHAQEIAFVDLTVL